jgi:uncharacterized ubiquitin-like protein YukD
MKRYIKNKYRLLIPVLSTIIAIISVLVISIPVGATATTSQNITVTNTPQFISISNNTSTYNFNATGAAHLGVLPNTTYYSNPGGQTTAPTSGGVVDGECAFDITDASSVAVDLTVNAADMSTGSDNSTNGNTTTPGASSYACWTYWSGVAFTSKVLCKSSGSGVAYSSLGATSNKYWGIEIIEQTNAWTGATPATFVVTVTASAH